MSNSPIYLDLVAGGGGTVFFTNTYSVEFIDGLAMIDSEGLPADLPYDALVDLLEKDNSVKIIDREQYELSYSVRTGNERVTKQAGGADVAEANAKLAEAQKAEAAAKAELDKVKAELAEAKKANEAQAEAKPAQKA